MTVWQGAKQVSQHFDLELWLPVNGDVSYVW